MDLHAICFKPPVIDHRVTGYICAVHIDEDPLKEFLSSVKDFVYEMPDDDLKVKGIELKELKQKVEKCIGEVNKILDILIKKIIFPGDCDYIK